MNRMKPAFNLPDYYRHHYLKAEIKSQTIGYYSKPGLPEWDTISPALRLLGEYAQPDPSNLVWCVNCGPGALAASIATYLSSGVCHVSSHDHLVLSCTEHTLREINLQNILIHSQADLPPQLAGSIDLVLMSISKGRNLNRRWLLQAWTALKPGGQLLLSGPKDLGVQTIIKDGNQLFQSHDILAYKKGNRLARYIKPEPNPPLPDWSFEPGIAPGTWHSINLNFPSLDLNLVSLPGVFSYTELDGGTNLLLSTIKDLTGQMVLDIGCGYGILGLFASRRGAQSIDMLDSNVLAVASTQENIARSGINNCRVTTSDLFAALPQKKYSLILTNPPFHAGKQIDYQITHTLIADSYAFLETNGTLLLVANRFIPYDRLMIEVFGNISTLAQTTAYQVLASKKVQV